MKTINIFGLIFLFGSIALIIANLESCNVEKYGEIVEMRIEKLPRSCIGTRVKHYVTLSYKEKKFIKQIPGMFCEEHKIGEFIKMKYLENNNDTLFLDESSLSNLIGFGLIGLIGLFILINNWLTRKQSNIKRFDKGKQSALRSS